MLAHPLTKMVDDLTTMVPKGITRILTATLGNDAGMIGAAAMARLGGTRQLVKPLNGVAATPAKAKS